jgi:peptidoglycan/LPS O-acetylase OafA/YrhL
MNPVLGGALTLASALAGLFFARFWRDSRDRLFLFFALAFLALAGNWLVLARSPRLPDTDAVAFLPRLLAFLLIIAGIIDKNRRSSRTNA